MLALVFRHFSRGGGRSFPSLILSNLVKSGCNNATTSLLTHSMVGSVLPLTLVEMNYKRGESF